jgi:hypothetical protein
VGSRQWAVGRKKGTGAGRLEVGGRKSEGGGRRAEGGGWRQAAGFFIHHSSISNHHFPLGRISATSRARRRPRFPHLQGITPRYLPWRYLPWGSQVSHHGVTRYIPWGWQVRTSWLAATYLQGRYRAKHTLWTARGHNCRPGGELRLWARPTNRVQQIA